MSDPIDNMKWVIFSIDPTSGTDVRSFMRLFTQADKPPPTRCTGVYKGTYEASFLCQYSDLRSVILDRHHGTLWMKNQESILLVSGCNKSYAKLVFRDGSTKGMGSLKNVSAEVAILNGDYTYVHSTDKYYICRDGNPDGIPPPQGWPSAETTEAIKRYISAIDAGCDALCHPVSDAHRRSVILDLVALRDFLSIQYGVN